MTAQWPVSLRPSLPYRFRYVSHTVSTVSPFTRSRRDEERIGARWAMEAHFGPLHAAEARLLEATLLALDGPVGRLMVPDWSYGGLRGGAAGVITATGAQHAKTLTLSGVGGVSPHFLAGDRLEVAERLHSIVADAVASGGNATVQIRPPLREAVTAAAVRLIEPRCKMQLPDDEQLVLAALHGPIRELTLQLVEALP